MKSANCISKDLLKFLEDLKKNNRREYFLKNKARYQENMIHFEMFIESLLEEMSKFDPSLSSVRGKECIFRIYRDVRFSKDKSPYKTHFGALLTPRTNKSEIHLQTGYYIHIEPGNSMIGAGAYMPESGWLSSIRKNIGQNPKPLKKILSQKEFKRYFGGLEGEKLKNVPKGFHKDHPDGELLKYKSYTAICKVSDQDTLSSDFRKFLVKAFHVAYPLNQYLEQSKIF